MAQLYFKYGAMGSSKTANALMARFNYEERGQKTLLVKPRLDQRDGDHMVHSRIGLEYPCIYFDEMLALSAEALQENACIIVDEAQFLSKEEVDYLVHIVDDLGVPVICYGLRADFKGELFPGSYELLVMADKLEEVKTICWCGKKAMFNARFDENGRVLKEGAQVVLFNQNAQGVLAGQNDNTDSPAINSVSAQITDGKAIPGNGGVVFTVERSGEYYRFRNETYGYLCSNGTGNNAFYSLTASDDADWTVEPCSGGVGGYQLSQDSGKGKMTIAAGVLIPVFLAVVHWIFKNVLKIDLTFAPTL